MLFSGTQGTLALDIGRMLFLCGQPPVQLLDLGLPLSFRELSIPARVTQKNAFEGSLRTGIGWCRFLLKQPAHSGD